MFCVLTKGHLCLFDDNLASTIILWNLSNDVDYGIENGSKAIALDQQNKSLHVRHASLYIYLYLPLLHDHDVKLPNFTFSGGREHKTTIFYFFFQLRYSPLEFNSRKIRQHLTN